MSTKISKESFNDNQIPQNTLTIIGALEDLGEQVASKSGSLTAEFIELFGNKVINFTIDSIEDIIEYVFPNIDNQNIQEITDELREKIKKIIEVVKIMASDEELNKDVNEILQLVSVTASNMIRTLISDLKKPVEESIEDIQESSEEIVVKLVQGTVRTTWNAFLAALDAVPFVGEIGGLINLASSAIKTGVEIAPPIIKNFGTFIDIINKSTGTVLDITDNSIDSFNKIVKKGSEIENRISDIEQRVARKIQGAADGIKQFEINPALPQLEKPTLPNIKKGSLSQLPKRYNKQVGGKKSKRQKKYKKKTRKMIIV